MTTLPDLFPDFAAHHIDTSAGTIAARAGGQGPPLLLLHGYPQSHVMWHRVAPQLAPHFSLVIPDLPGYGASAAPESDAHHAPYDKRSMAKAMVELMQALGHERFLLAGHDRGGRVAYRLALDHAARVDKLATLDIVPTSEMWHGMDRAMAMKTYHWLFLAQPVPLPEMMIEKVAVPYLEWTLASWTKAKSISAFDARALEHYQGSTVACAPGMLTHEKLSAYLETLPKGDLLMRGDSVAFPPGGCALTHVHQGPGIRCLIEGGIRIDTHGRSTSYGAGGAWYEGGPDPVFAQAAADRPSRFIRVMILPRELTGKSSIRYVNEEDAAKPKSQSYKIYADAPIEFSGKR